MAERARPDLRGRTVAADTRFLVGARVDGAFAALTVTGVILLPTGRGALAEPGAGVRTDGEVCMSSTNRNFRGRTDAAGARVQLALPCTATAVAGRISDPREFLY